MKKYVFLLFLAPTVFLAPSMAQEPDWSEYAMLLRHHVAQGVRHGTSLAQVNYAALKEDARLQRVIHQLATFPVRKLESRRERLAFYINAYNILAIKMVVDHWPVESIKDIGSLFQSVWKKTAGTLGGRSVTLNEIEHRILRRMGEPRIHLAIVCASISCPDLRSEPYAADTLDTVLDNQASRFLDNQTKGLRVEGHVVRVSKIFNWFEEDFNAVGGVPRFLRRYRKNIPTRLPVTADLPYDWRLNSG